METTYIYTNIWTFKKKKSRLYKKQCSFFSNLLLMHVLYVPQNSVGKTIPLHLLYHACEFILYCKRFLLIALHFESFLTVHALSTLVVVKEREIINIQDPFNL